MSFIRGSLLAVIAVIALCSCEKTYRLDTNVRSIHFPAEGGQFVLSSDTDIGPDWIITEDKKKEAISEYNEERKRISIQWEWVCCKYGEYCGLSTCDILVEADPNPTGTKRKCFLDISDREGIGFGRIAIHQDGRRD